MLIRAEITDKDDSSGRWLYEWTERGADFADGDDIEPDSARSGTVDVNPAVEINDNEIDVGTVVWLRPRGFVGGSMWWEFARPPAGASASFTQVAGYTITADNTWEYTGVSVSLPGPGKYLLQFWSNAYGQCSALGGALTNNLLTKFFDYTTGSPVGVDESYTNAVTVQVAGQPVLQNFSMFVTVTVTAAAVYRVYAHRVKGAGTTWTISAIGNSGVSVGGVGYFKIG